MTNEQAVQLDILMNDCLAKKGRNNYVALKPNDKVSKLETDGFLVNTNNGASDWNYYIVHDKLIYLDDSNYYVNKLKTQKDNQESESELKRLDKLSKELTIENLEYQKTIRNLEEELKISTLFKNWWWLIGSAIVLGGILASAFT